MGRRRKEKAAARIEEGGQEKGKENYQLMALFGVCGAGVVLRRGLAARGKLGRHVTLSAVRKRCMEIEDERDFQRRVLESSSPTLVDFHATSV